MKGSILATAMLLAATGATAAQPSEDAPAAEAAASAEQAASTAPSAASDAAQAPPQEEKKICRTEKATGSLTRRNRICMTATQWREIYDRTRRGVSEMQGSASGAPACISAQDTACGAPSRPGF